MTSDVDPRQTLKDSFRGDCGRYRIKGRTIRAIDVDDAPGSRLAFTTVGVDERDSQVRPNAERRRRVEPARLDRAPHSLAAIPGVSLPGWAGSAAHPAGRRCDHDAFTILGLFGPLAEVALPEYLLTVGILRIAT